MMANDRGMNIFSKMLKMSDKKTKAKSVSGDIDIYDEVGTSYRGGSFTFDWAKGNAYDNIYPSISRIANGFVAIRPYAIGANGEPLQDKNTLNRIYHPNQQMSSAEFREALAIMALVHRKTYILVWHTEDGKAVAGAGENLTEENIAGFTFLEDAYVIVKNGHKFYKSASYNYEFTEKDVIELTAGVDPYDIQAGYSPTQAVKKWSNIDDFAADYEGGLLDNGAVPAGQFTITASTVEQFDAIVDEMQRRHRGAGNNNNVQYVHRPTDTTTGKPLSAQIEWTPFAQTNQSLDLGTIFKQANQKIDATFGVPASIRGVNEKNTYASVKVDERVFVNYTLRPFAMKVWTKMTHELNRITGGLGYAITFDLETPDVADEEKVIAEKKKIELDLISEALDRGFTLDSIVDAFELSNGYKLLKTGENDTPTIENDKPDVDEGEEVEDSPAQAITKGCCHHHDGEVSKSQDKTSLIELRKILNDYFNAEIEATIESLSASKSISAIGLEQYDENGDGLIDELEAEQIPVPEPTEEKKYLLALALLAVLKKRMQKSGEKRFKEVIEQFGLTITIPELQKYQVSREVENTVKDNLATIASSYSDQIVSAIKGAIRQTVAEGNGKTTKKDLVKAIQNTVKTDGWRTERIANTEEHRADNLGQIDAINELKTATGREFGLKWRTTSVNPCEFCQAMAGTVVATGEAFLTQGERVELAGGGSYINTRGDMLTPEAHPNCQCVFEVVEL